LVRTLLVALAVALVTLGGSGCSALTGESLDRIVERELGISPDPDWDDGPESFDTEEGTVTGTLLMPEGWPSDVPVPSDFEVVGASDTASDDEAKVVITGLTRVRLPHLERLYTDALADWERTPDLQGDDWTPLLMEFTRENRTVRVRARDDETLRHLTIAHEEHPSG
jgi:hypothetical protein